MASGDLFRENLKHNTPLGQTARHYIERGELVPDDITIAMVGTDPGHVDFGVYFDQHSLRATSSATSTIARRSDGCAASVRA